VQKGQVRTTTCPCTRKPLTRYRCGSIQVDRGKQGVHTYPTSPRVRPRFLKKIPGKATRAAYPQSYPRMKCRIKGFYRLNLYYSKKAPRRKGAKLCGGYISVRMFLWPMFDARSGHNSQRTASAPGIPGLRLQRRAFIVTGAMCCAKSVGAPSKVVRPWQSCASGQRFSGRSLATRDTVAKRVASPDMSIVEKELLGVKTVLSITWAIKLARAPGHAIVSDNAASSS
jgi:hypothetical protein